MLETTSSLRFTLLFAILSASLSSANVISSSKLLDNYEWTDQRQPGESKAEVDSPSTVLDNFVEKETEKLIRADGGCPKVEHGISKYMDSLALQVAHESVQGQHADLFQEQIAKAINLDDIIPNLNAHTPKSRKARHNAFALSKGIFEALESADQKVVQQGRKLTDIGRAHLAEFAVSGLTTPEKFKVLEMFFASHSAATQRLKNNIWNYRPEMYEPKKKPVQEAPVKFRERVEMTMKFIFKAIKLSITLIDNFYLSSVFLDKLPIIGECVQTLRKKGEPIHNIIQTVRTFRATMELERGLRGDAASDVGQLMLPSAEEAHKMLSEAGIDALKMVSSKLVRKYSNVEIEHKSLVEILSRVAYYLFALFAPKSTHCLLGSI